MGLLLGVIFFLVGLMSESGLVMFFSDFLVVFMLNIL